MHIWLLCTDLVKLYIYNARLTLEVDSGPGDSGQQHLYRIAQDCALYTHSVEMVQRRAARFVSRRYHNTSSVTDMLRKLQWESLEHRRWKARLTMFYKVQFGLVAVPLPDVVTRAPRERPGHPHQFQTPYCSTNSYRDSFFPLAIVQWNALPSSVACRASLPLFQADLSSLS